MTAKEKEDAINELTAYIHCLKCDRSGKVCDDNCPTQYEAGNCGEIIKNLEFLLEEVKKMPTLFKSAYNLLAYYEPLEPCEDAISRVDARNCITGHSLRNLMIDSLDSLPAVLPKIKSGKWIDKFGGEYRCSCCREIISIDTEIEFPNGITYKYCPNCGAKMEK